MWEQPPSAVRRPGIFGPLIFLRAAFVILSEDWSLRKAQRPTAVEGPLHSHPVANSGCPILNVTYFATFRMGSLTLQFTMGPLTLLQPCHPERSFHPRMRMKTQSKDPYPQNGPRVDSASSPKAESPVRIPSEATRT